MGGCAGSTGRNDSPFWLAVHRYTRCTHVLELQAVHQGLCLQDPGDCSVNELRGVVYIDNVVLKGAKYASGCLQVLATMSDLALLAGNSLNSRKLEVVKIHETREGTAFASSLVCFCSALPPQRQASSFTFSRKLHQASFSGSSFLF